MKGNVLMNFDNENTRLPKNWSFEQTSNKNVGKRKQKIIISSVHKEENKEKIRGHLGPE